MVGPQRKQRKPIISKQSGTQFKFKFETKNKEEQRTASQFIDIKSSRKKPLMLTGTTAPATDNKETEKTDKRIGHKIEDEEKEN